jgi:ABC-type phosphate/phosphonate transport system substrate-binding protein
MSGFIANARMYAVAPAAEAAWAELLARVAAEAGLRLPYLPYPAPQPLEALWTRPDLGAVLMCGYPIARGLADVVPLAAPIPAADWADGRAVYRSDLIVRRDAPFRCLADTFGHRTGWTVIHSQSGFNAWRHHLLPYRNSARPRLFAESRGDLVTARRILDAVVAGEIEIGPLDAYWHLLLRHHRPDLTASVRVLESTALVPAPAFVCALGMPQADALRLRAAFLAAASRSWFAHCATPLCLAGFAAIAPADYGVTLAWDTAARLADYPVPA